MDIRRLATAGLIFVSTSFAASAATLDFITESNGNERGVADGYVLENANTSGLAVTLSADGGSAYFDSGDAGLGVCGTLTASKQCNPSNDDNITAGESVFLQIEKDAGSGYLSGVLNKVFFRNAGHGASFGAGAMLDYTLDGGASWMTRALTGMIDFGGAAFTSAGIGFRYNNAEIYVANVDLEPVPLPAGALLLITGMGGLAAVRRRRKN